MDSFSKKQICTLIFVALLLLPGLSFSFVGSCAAFFDDVYRTCIATKKLTRGEFSHLLIASPASLKGISRISELTHPERMMLYSHIAVEKRMMSITQQTYYINCFNKIGNGETLLISAIKNNKNLDQVLKNNEFLQTTKRLPSTWTKRVQGQTVGIYKNMNAVQINGSAGKVIGSYRPSYFYDSSKAIRMPSVIFLNGNKTTTGYLRNSKTYWNMYKKEHGNDLSIVNLRRIENNQAPIVDSTWLKAYPSHKYFIGEILEHHHINHGGLAIPLPKTLHRLNGNYEVFHSL